MSPSKLLFSLALPVCISFSKVPVPVAAVPCTSELVSQCSAATTPGFNFLKTYALPFTAEDTEVEYSYVFANGTDYQLRLCPGRDTDLVKVRIMDKNRTVVNETKLSKNVSVMEFRCKGTGIYYLDFSTNFECCAAASLSFRRLPAVDQH